MHRKVLNRQTTWAEGWVSVDRIAEAVDGTVDGSYSGRELGWPAAEFYRVETSDSRRLGDEPMIFEIHQATELKKILGSFGL
jgi:hypothetical protein